MPARGNATFQCFCHECSASGGVGPSGEALGKSLKISERVAHLNRIKREAEALERSRIDAVREAASSLFADTLSDNGPNVEGQPSKLWVPRDEYQHSRQPLPAEPPPVEAILAGIQHLQIQDLSLPTGGPSLPTAGLSLPTGGTEGNLSPGQVSNKEDDSPPPLIKMKPRLDKREHNRKTEKAHLSLKAIKQRAENCSSTLSTSSTADSLNHVEAELIQLDKSLKGVRGSVHSVVLEKATVTKFVVDLHTRFTEIRKAVPRHEKGPVLFNTDHHFDMPINNHDPVAQMAMFISVVCAVIMGVSRRMGDFILGLLSVMMRCAFRDPSGNFTVNQESIMNQIPLTLETALAKFNLEPQTVTHAVCPSCHCTYPPTFAFGSTTPSYPEECSHRPTPDSDICRTRLLDPDDSAKPSKIVIYHSFHDFLGGLLSQTDLETMADNTNDNLMESIKKGEPIPAYVTDISQAEFMRTFKGPDGHHLFVDRPGTEGRYLFAINVDFFSAEGQTIRGPSASCGIISAVCLSLPLSVRYKPENIYIACIIPGPNEPHNTELNHYLRPVIDDFLASWEHGVQYSRTANYPTGRLTRSAIALAVNDLPAARKFTQFATHSSHHYCSRCHCYHQSTLGRSDVEAADWRPKDAHDLRCQAEAWRDAPTVSDQEKLFQANGVRWSEVWRLPYWDPPRMLVVDSMHCLLLGLAQFHFREVLCLREVKEKTEDIPAFVFEFMNPDDNFKGQKGVSENDLKHITQLHKLLVQPIEGHDEPTPETLNENLMSLETRFSRKNFKALEFVSSSLGIPPATTGRTSKAHYVNGLMLWRKQRPYNPMFEPAVKFGTPEVMDHIRTVIRDMDTPSWLPSVPRNFGLPAAGTLKADEWRTMATVYLPVALISKWGEGSIHPSQSAALSLRKVLDHTMALVSAISLACMRTMTEARSTAYLTNMRLWVHDLTILHPDSKPRVNGHIALHIFDFLRLFGPVRSWWCFPFERLIGQLQRLPHNHKFGELEATMLTYYAKAAKLKHWLARPDCPPFIKECKALFDKFAGNSTVTSDNDVIPDSAYAPVPDALKSLIRDPKVALRARHRYNNVFFSRSSTHVGNSLILYRPDGKASASPIPASIEYIVARRNKQIEYVVRPQLPVAPGSIDPFRHYPHFPAKIYSPALSPNLLLVRPEWIVSHYARWTLDEARTVILTLSRD